MRIFFTFLLALACCGCGSDKPRLNAAGSSFVFPIMSRWAADYDKAKNVEVNYQPIGSGGGMQQMTVKTADFGCTDAPMNEEQLRKAAETGGKVLHIPLVLGAIVPVYNLPDVKTPILFSGPVLADIFLGKIKKWNDKALKDLNPGTPLPEKDIGVVYRSDGSGSTYVWVDYLGKVSPEWKTKVGVATSVRWPVGEGAKGSEGIAGRVKESAGTLGFIELTYALRHDIKFGRVRNKAGADVVPDLKSIAAAADNSLQEIPDDLRCSITDAPGKDSYPICGMAWAVLYADQPAGKGKEVVQFLRWVTHDGQQTCEQLDYARLPRGLVERVEKKLDAVTIR